VPEARLGVIGGSGLYQIEGLTDVEEVRVKTPFGDPSDAIVLGTLEGERVAFLPRHGRGHRILPTEIIDRTRSRANSFFGGGIVVHVTFADPFCPVLSQALYQACQGEGVAVHKGGTLVVMEGPLFSTRAESFLYRSWGADIIGMTALPEAKLAREAEICYSTLASVTDYDCWHEGHASVNIEMVIANLKKNVERAKSVLRKLVTAVPGERDCPCATALKDAIITDTKLIPAKRKQELALLIGKYLPAEGR